LHAPNQKLRQELIPSAKNYPIDELMQECREYVQLTKRRLSFEYTLLADYNDRPEHAEQLAKLVRGFQCHVNLIPYNPIPEAPYQRPDQRRIDLFQQALQERHVAVSVRYSRGLEADAACGQLRTRNS
jgi:23S rRNA (adenine2503-C2)-methyltransferase